MQLLELQPQAYSFTGQREYMPCVRNDLSSRLFSPLGPEVSSAATRQQNKREQIRSVKATLADAVW